MKNARFVGIAAGLLLVLTLRPAFAGGGGGDGAAASQSDEQVNRDTATQAGNLPATIDQGSTYAPPSVGAANPQNQNVVNPPTQSSNWNSSVIDPGGTTQRRGRTSN